MTTESTTKVCKGCGVEQELSCYRLSKGRYYENKCKACTKLKTQAWREANPDKVKATAKRSRVKNADKVKARNKAWYEANKDKDNASSRAWYEANKDRAAQNKAEWRDNNRSKVRESNRKHYYKYKDREKARNQENKLKASYGLTLAQLTEMYEARKGKCDICGSVYAMRGRSTECLHVDHDHQTGEVRGLLCLKCNTGLGKLGDNLAGLMRAVEYLKSKEAS